MKMVQNYKKKITQNPRNKKKACLGKSSSNTIHKMILRRFNFLTVQPTYQPCELKESGKS